ncbi:MAG: YidC/Oxa1 family insertase periplasmic-domain containing protein [Sedimentisphaerales bacterium]|nr:YidC/Oxa1 family insertase periplasmic-domain containing protein [Sedimentisphaerales bacterium]MBN2842266.1 YidC/Oxa1 family insertase periplasmic-domain containing protein [Sedimentisphaerales bacterium]
MDIKRFIVSFAIFMVILFGFQMWMGQGAAPKQSSTNVNTATEQTATDNSSETVPGIADDAVGQAQDVSEFTGLHALAALDVNIPAEPVTLGGLGDDLDYNALINFDRASASVKSVLANRQKYKVSDTEYGYPLLNSCKTAAGIEYSSFMVTSVKLEGFQKRVDLTDNCWNLVSKDADTLRFSASIYNGPKHLLDIVKVFTFASGSHELTFDIELENKCDQSVKVEFLGLTGPAGLINDDPRADRRNVFVGYYKNTNAFTVELVNAAKVKDTSGAFVNTPENKPMEWFAHSNKFFTSVMRSVPAQGALFAPFVVNSVHARPAFLTTGPEEMLNKDALVVYTEIVPGAIAAGQVVKCNYQIYMGPIDLELFEQEPFARLQYKLTAGNSSCAICTFAWLNAIIFQLMQLCYWATGNYGISIIFLVFLVRLLLHPITKKSQINMMQMSKMGPKIEEIKKKYGDNPKEMQRQMALVYKDQGFSPVLGCLPMLLQMPIWIALYTSVDSNIGLRHQGLFPAGFPWLNDLSAPDRLIPFTAFGAGPIDLPLLGHIDAFNLLPILLTIAMFFQSRASMNQSTAPVSPEAAQQQKMMMYMMPGMMLLFFYTAPSGLNLYIMASTFAGLIEQKRIKKHLQEQEEIQRDGVVVVTGKMSERLRNKGKNSR